MIRLAFLAWLGLASIAPAQTLIDIGSDLSPARPAQTATPQAREIELYRRGSMPIAEWEHWTSRPAEQGLWIWSPAAKHHQAVAIVKAADGATGSGTYVTIDGFACVLSAAHVTESRTATCTFANGKQLKGTVYSDKFGNDISAIAISDPGVPPAPIAEVMPSTGQVELTGHGGPGNHLRHFFAAITSSSKKMMESNGRVLNGDSGGGWFDQAGRLVAVQSGGLQPLQTGPNEHFPVYDGATATCCGPIRQFLARVRQRLMYQPQYGQCGPQGCPDGRCGPQKCPDQGPRYEHERSWGGFRRIDRYFPPSPKQPQPEVQPLPIPLVPIPEPEAPAPEAEPPGLAHEELVSIVSAVAERLRQDATFQDLVRGPAGRDGKDGKDGQPGSPGPPGKDGLTPAFDIDHVISEVAASLPPVHIQVLSPSGEVLDEQRVPLGQPIRFQLKPVE